MDEWLLHIVGSPSASEGRGLVRGKMFNQDGQLVASTAQRCDRGDGPAVLGLTV